MDVRLQPKSSTQCAGWNDTQTSSSSFAGGMPPAKEGNRRKKVYYITVLKRGRLQFYINIFYRINFAIMIIVAVGKIFISIYSF
jgi:hypothetical protein